jgi:hypothetical protein
LRAVGLAGALIAACGGVGGLGRGTTLAAILSDVACPELRGGAMNATFDADAKANATIRAFVTASGDLLTVAAKMEGDVADACERMGRDLGVTAEQMAPRSEESRVSAACRAFYGRMDTILRQGASASIRADVTPPQCEVNGEVEASCRGQCAARVDPGYVKAHCEPGHLYGRCEGTCAGRCDGTCGGQCDGTCNALGASGQCAGACNGRCRGACSADCHGSCDVELKEPKCDVALRGPSADARCESSCKAHADLTAECSQPRVSVKANVDAAEVVKLAATLEANLPMLVRAELAYGKRLADDVGILVQTGAELPRAFGHLSGRAAACVAAAANACVSAQASFRVSVQASASITARAGASTN